MLTVYYVGVAVVAINFHAFGNNLYSKQEIKVCICMHIHSCKLSVMFMTVLAIAIAT